MPRQLVRNFGTCLNFNAGTDQVSVANSSTLGLTTALTLCAWIKPLDLNGPYGIIDKNRASAYSLHISAAGKLRFQSTLGTYDSASTLKPATWTHVAVTYDSANVKHYINGTLDATNPNTSAIATNSASLLIGALNDGFNFYGRIDEVRIYTRTLTATEITNFFYGAEPSSSNLVLYFKFDEGSGTTATDSSNTGNTGTISGPTYSTDVFIKPRVAAT